ncbi:MAG TPA: thiamine-phosphate kinase [Thermoplasmata archaeon]|nr:thiamine-phosphate kinase [Thermoplasmata archaeon]
MPSPPRLDERAFHRWLHATLTGPARGRLPLGDDCAALPLGGGRVALLTTDALVEWTHFLPRSPPGLIGEAAANASLSDLAAKGGTPVALTLDLLLPAETPASWARQVVRGADRAMRRFGGAVVGGDTKVSRTPTVVGTALGIGRADRLAPRSGARPGDRLAVTGKVGRGGVAYQRFTSRGPEDRAALAGLLRIAPRLAEGAALVRFAHAVLDTSDGLADGARRIAEGSRVEVVVDAASLPLAPPLRATEDGDVPELAFFGGDYELLAAVPPGRFAAARRAVAAAGGRLTDIGEVRRGSKALLRNTAGVEATMPSMGWRPFG